MIAKDKATEKEQKVTITHSSGLSKNEVEKMVADARSHETEDKERRELVEVKNRAENLQYQMEKLVKENRDKLSADPVTSLESALKQLESSAPDEIKADVTTVSEAFTSLISVFESANYDFTKLAQDPEALAKLESFSGQEVQDASTRIEAYFSQVCGISTTDTTP